MRVCACERVYVYAGMHNFCMSVYMYVSIIISVKGDKIIMNVIANLYNVVQMYKIPF